MAIKQLVTNYIQPGQAPARPTERQGTSPPRQLLRRALIGWWRGRRAVIGGEVQRTGGIRDPG